MKKLNDFPSRTEKVVINQLEVDETYQRPVSKAKVNKTVKNYCCLLYTSDAADE